MHAITVTTVGELIKALADYCPDTKVAALRSFAHETSIADLLVFGSHGPLVLEYEDGENTIWIEGEPAS